MKVDEYKTYDDRIMALLSEFDGACCKLRAIHCDKLHLNDQSAGHLAAVKQLLFVNEKIFALKCAWEA